MKEYLSSIEPEVYDEICYPQIVMGHMVGQKTLDGDLLLYASPEKYPPIEADPIPEPKPQRHALQGEFILTRRIKLKPLILDGGRRART